MHGSAEMTADLISGVAQRALEKAVSSQQKALPYDILVCPPSPYLSHAITAAGNQPIMVGAQNASAHAHGAYTGEISLPMLDEIGCQYVLLGHSERREIFGETDSDIAEKFSACIASKTNVIPVLCIGETLQDRQAGNTERVVAAQLDAVLDSVGIRGFQTAVIAYEPVWAIGTGETASPEQAQEVHAFIRAKLARLDADVADRVQILYGGSVKPDNAEQLFAQTDIDGGLIGGASLKVESFAGICKVAEKLAS